MASKRKLVVIKKLAAALQKQDKYTLHMFCLSKEGIFYCFVLLQEVSRKNLFNVLNVTILTNFIYFPPFCAIVLIYFLILSSSLHIGYRIKLVMHFPTEKNIIY
jgi:hypothetical protein